MRLKYSVQIIPYCITCTVSVRPQYDLPLNNSKLRRTHQSSNARRRSRGRPRELAARGLALGPRADARRGSGHTRVGRGRRRRRRDTCYVKNKAGLTGQTVTGRRIPGHWPTPVPEALAEAEPVTLVTVRGYPRGRTHPGHSIRVKKTIDSFLLPHPTATPTSACWPSSAGRRAGRAMPHGHGRTIYSMSRLRHGLRTFGLPALLLYVLQPRCKAVTSFWLLLLRGPRL